MSNRDEKDLSEKYKTGLFDDDVKPEDRADDRDIERELNEQSEYEPVASDHDDDEFEDDVEVADKPVPRRNNVAAGPWDRPAETPSSALSASPPAPSAAPPAASSRSASALIWPWAITAIAVAALIFVLVRNGGFGEGGSASKAPSGSASGNIDMNEQVGSIDGATFTRTDIYELITTRMMSPGQEGQILDSLMLERIIEQKADSAGIVLTDEDYEQDLSAIRAQFAVATNEELIVALQQQGQGDWTVEKLKDQFKTNILFRKIIELEQPTTDETLQAYYNEHLDQFQTSPKRVQASHILVASQEEADAVLTDLKAGKDFAALAKEKSTDPGSKDNGGDLGFFGSGEMVAEFEQAAFALGKNEISGVVQSQHGFHIIKVTDIQEAVVPSFEEIKEQVRSASVSEKFAEAQEPWLEQAKEELHYDNTLIETPEPTAS